MFCSLQNLLEPLNGGFSGGQTTSKGVKPPETGEKPPVKPMQKPPVRAPEGLLTTYLPQHQGRPCGFKHHVDNQQFRLCTVAWSDRKRGPWMDRSAQRLPDGAPSYHEGERRCAPAAQPQALQERLLE